MNKEERKNMNIHERINEIVKLMPELEKTAEVKAGKGSFKAVTIKAVKKAVKELEYKYGVASKAVDREIVDSGILEKEKDYKGEKSVTYTFWARYKHYWEFVNVDNPEDRTTTVSYSLGMDTGDKGDGKAMSYGDKSALISAYKIVADEDVDTHRAWTVEEQNKARSKVGAYLDKQLAAHDVQDKKDEVVTKLCESLNVFSFEDIDFNQTYFGKTTKDYIIERLSDIIKEVKNKKPTEEDEGLSV